MFAWQANNIKKLGYKTRNTSSKDLSYNNFILLSNKFKAILNNSIHLLAIVISKMWARLTHFISSIFHKGARMVEEQLIKHEKKNGVTDTTKQSVFITTIKSYKSEIRKLKNRVEEELPRPRTEDKNTSVDKEEDINTID
jgi:hypothetical protein